METTIGRDHRGNMIKGARGPPGHTYGLGHSLEYNPSESPPMFLCLRAMMLWLALDPWIQLEPDETDEKSS